jgi:hypothetical protein
MSRKRERENPCFICNHYHNYEAGEVCGVCGHGPTCAVALPAPPSAFPTEVLPSFLYLGSYDHASRSELLKAMGIKRILNVRSARVLCVRGSEAAAGCCARRRYEAPPSTRARGDPRACASAFSPRTLGLQLQALAGGRCPRHAARAVSASTLPPRMRMLCVSFPRDDPPDGA